MSKRYGKFSKFTFTAHASGQHYFCFQTNSTKFSVFAGERLVRPTDTERGEIIQNKMLRHAQDNLLICLCRVVQKLHLDIQMGEHVIGHDTHKTKDKMETLENNLSHLVDQMKYITMQQEYQRVSISLHCLKKMKTMT